MVGVRMACLFDRKGDESRTAQRRSTTFNWTLYLETSSRTVENEAAELRPEMVELLDDSKSV